MDIEKNIEFDRELKDYLKAQPSGEKGAGVRSKSANRIRYEAEATLLRKKLGDLESIRQQLGLSQRKICQLLFVDPSAWTRWTKRGDDAPPHVYRSLQWYLALQDKYPALDVNFWLGTSTRSSQVTARNEAEIQALQRTQASEIHELKHKLRLLVAVNFIFALSLVAFFSWLVLKF